MNPTSKQQWGSVLDSLEDPGDRVLELWLAAVGDTLRYALPEAIYLQKEIEGIIAESKALRDDTSGGDTKEIERKCQSIISIPKNILEGISKDEMIEYFDMEIGMITNRKIFRSWPFAAAFATLIIGVPFVWFGLFQNHFGPYSFGALTGEERDALRERAAERLAESLRDGLATALPDFQRRLDELARDHQQAIAKEARTSRNELTTFASGISAELEAFGAGLRADLEKAGARQDEELKVREAALSRDLRARTTEVLSDTNRELHKVRTRQETTIAAMDTILAAARDRLAGTEAEAGNIEARRAELEKELQRAKGDDLERIELVGEQIGADLRARGEDHLQRMEGKVKEVTVASEVARTRVDGIVSGLPSRVAEVEQTVKALENLYAKLQVAAVNIDTVLTRKEEVVQRLERMLKSIEQQ